MKKPKRKQKKARQKAIRLNKALWLRSAKEIKAYRETELLFQEGLCAITSVPLETGCLDHVHACGAGYQGRVRGVLLSESNLLEGKYLKLFRKMKMDEKYGLTFPEFLINMGVYLQQDNSNKPFHYAFMDEYRNYTKRLTKAEIIRKLDCEFGLKVEAKTLHRDLVQLYMQEWIDRLESKYLK